jgi:DNA-binding NarL/FixJ family response regulator
VEWKRSTLKFKSSIMVNEIIKVAIVEDEKDLRETMKLILDASPGIECDYTFTNAEDAVELIPDLDLDVLIMDINLPGITGAEAVRIIKKRLPDLQVMMCTVYEDDENIFKALSNGASGYILKPVTSSQLVEAILDLHKGGSPMSSDIARKVVASLHTKERDEDWELLTDREKQILDRLDKGFFYKEIADELGVKIDTIKKHIYNIYGKLHVQSRTEAINKMYKKR